MASFFRKHKTPSAESKPPQPDKQSPAAMASKKGTVKTEDAVKEVVKSAVRAKGFFTRAPTVVGIHLSSSGEADRLKEDKDRGKNWKRWGPYLSERQWATVREDYSPDGSWYALRKGGFVVWLSVNVLQPSKHTGLFVRD